MLPGISPLILSSWLISGGNVTDPLQVSRYSIQEGLM